MMSHGALNVAIDQLDAENKALKAQLRAAHEITEEKVLLAARALAESLSREEYLDYTFGTTEDDRRLQKRIRDTARYILEAPQRAAEHREIVAAGALGS